MPGCFIVCHHCWLLQIIGLLRKISPLLECSFAKETTNFKEPTNCIIPVCVIIAVNNCDSCACVRVCECACVRVRVRVRVRACVRACVCGLVVVRVCVYECVCVYV